MPINDYVFPRAFALGTYPRRDLAMVRTHPPVKFLLMCTSTHTQRPPSYIDPFCSAAGFLVQQSASLHALSWRLMEKTPCVHSVPAFAILREKFPDIEDRARRKNLYADLSVAARSLTRFAEIIISIYFVIFLR